MSWNYKGCYFGDRIGKKITIQPWKKKTIESEISALFLIALSYET